MAKTLIEVTAIRNQTLKEFRLEIGQYAAAHPNAPFREVAQLFRCSQATVSQAARSIGLMPRQRGRKPQQPKAQAAEAE
jgi:hypothetical protein